MALSKPHPFPLPIFFAAEDTSCDGHENGEGT